MADPQDQPDGEPDGASTPPAKEPPAKAVKKTAKAPAKKAPAKKAPAKKAPAKKAPAKKHRQEPRNPRHPSRPTSRSALRSGSKPTANLMPPKTQRHTRSQP